MAYSLLSGKKKEVGQEAFLPAMFHSHETRRRILIPLTWSTFTSCLDDIFGLTVFSKSFLLQVLVLDHKYNNRHAHTIITLSYYDAMQHRNGAKGY